MLDNWEFISTVLQIPIALHLTLSTVVHIQKSLLQNNILFEIYTVQ
jgi:hypothetical protein